LLVIMPQATACPNEVFNTLRINCNIHGLYPSVRLELITI
jgi:hypothetical protein